MEKHEIQVFFFRSSEQWLPQFTSYLEKMIDMKIIHDNRLITMTSLGASTGEEAYSMAILLWKALESKGENPKNWNIEISAYDRDARAVQAIEEALYPDQELGDAFQEMWKTAEDLSRFAPVDQQSQGRYRVMNATLRSWVKPQVADISDESFIIPKSDVIFANNLLMYFSQSDADRVTRMITDFSWGNEGYPSFFTMTERNQTRKTEDNLDQLGGIDLTSTMSGFETEGGGLDFDIPIEFKDFDIDGVKGFTPVILQIVPTNLPLLLGINSEVDIQQLSLK